MGTASASASAKKSVEQKLHNKNIGIKIIRIKIGGDPQILGGGHPPSVSAKRSQWNKSCKMKTVE